MTVFLRLEINCSHQHFHYTALIAVFIITVSPILSSPQTADQMLMAHAAVCWLTIISMAFTAHIKRVTVMDETQSRGVWSVSTVTFLHNYRCSHVGKWLWHTHRHAEAWTGAHVMFQLNSYWNPLQTSLSQTQLMPTSSDDGNWKVTPVHVVTLEWREVSTETLMRHRVLLQQWNGN